MSVVTNAQAKQGTHSKLFQVMKSGHCCDVSGSNYQFELIMLLHHAHTHTHTVSDTYTRTLYMSQ